MQPARRGGGLSGPHELHPPGGLRWLRGLSGLPASRGLSAIDGRVRLLGALLALVAGFDVLILPAALSPAAPMEAARLAELAWWALWVVFGLAVLRCAAWRPDRALAPARVRVQVHEPLGVQARPHR